MMRPDLSGWVLDPNRENQVLLHSCDLGIEEAGAGRLMLQFKTQPGLYCEL